MVGRSGCGDQGRDAPGRPGRAGGAGIPRFARRPWRTEPGLALREISSSPATTGARSPGRSTPPTSPTSRDASGHVGVKPARKLEALNALIKAKAVPASLDDLSHEADVVNFWDGAEERERRDHALLEKKLKFKIERLDPRHLLGGRPDQPREKARRVQCVARDQRGWSTSGSRGVASSAIGSVDGIETFSDRLGPRPEGRCHHGRRRERLQVPRCWQSLAQGADAGACPRGRLGREDPRGASAHPRRGGLRAARDRAGSASAARGSALGRPGAGLA